jgi:phosphoadenosine phosphosulfate reductase
MQTANEIRNIQLSDQISGLNTEQALQFVAGLFPKQVVFSTSFSMEDQVITDLILSQEIPVFLFTLDTGRQFSETYSVWSRTEEKYGTRIRAFYPDHELLEAYVGEKGPNAFYESVANRKTCCHIRKVEPLQRALKGQAVWITGLRAAHSRERKETGLTEWDDSNKVIKYNPLFHWSDQKIQGYIQKNNLPYNPLYDQGFPSIGCAPCTRAVKPGEDPRAGRWWWEDAEKKECGLHIHI